VRRAPWRGRSPAGPVQGDVNMMYAGQVGRGSLAGGADQPHPSWVPTLRRACLLRTALRRALAHLQRVSECVGRHIVELGQQRRAGLPLARRQRAQAHLGGQAWQEEGTSGVCMLVG
jgi:hypothetical protein